MNSPLKICLIGFGKMGQTVKHLTENDPELHITYVIDKTNNNNGEAFSTSGFLQADVVIDFSHPDGVVDSIKACLDIQKPIVVGTTGWLTYRSEIEQLIQKNGGKVLYGSNFSLGVQLFNKLIHRAAELFGNSSLFDASLHEVHHTQKADSPSGTALTLAKTYVEHASTKKEIAMHLPEKEKVNPDTFYVTAQRLGNVFGEHELRIFSKWDDIKISHTALTREGFAAGALKAAKWLIHQEKDGFYVIEDVAEEVVLS
ncbi:4-hydroxy-tetrahydrodipicolinate reductase [bacterium]|nr:MAG: 4-hydroxy-tetrahydrodipicolinate reductase [bacterium]